MDIRFIISLLTAMAGTTGFAMILKVRPRYLPAITALGGGCYAIYYLMDTKLALGSFVASLLSTMFVAVTAEFLARLIKTPSPVFTLPSIVSIVPGSFLYKAMRSMITNDIDGAVSNGWEVIKIAMGVAGGIVVVSVLVNIYTSIYRRIKKEK